jgi:hypothetical protein
MTSYALCEEDTQVTLQSLKSIESVIACVAIAGQLIFSKTLLTK